MNVLKIVFAGIFCLNLFPLFAQQKKQVAAAPDKPALVIGIIVDQMKYEYLFRYAEKFGNDGFKRLMKEGFFCENTHYNYVPTFTGPGHAAVYTGTTPSVNGIIGNDWYQQLTNDTMYCTADQNAETVGSTNDAGKMSPVNLISTTITDELRIATNFQSKVIAISMKDRGAILPGGRTANGAYWYDSKSGNWITSSYYMNELPKWVNDFNAQKISEKYVHQKWNTLLPIEKYTESTADDNDYEEPFKGETRPIFPHDFPALHGKDFELVRKSPFGNTLIKDFAIAALRSENLGKGKYTDFLAVSFSSTDYIGHQFGVNAVETEDCYLRLDKDIADLLKFIDGTYGKRNVVIFLTADHGAMPNAALLEDHKVNAGIFNTRTLSDLLNHNLKNELGSDSLISCIINDNVYLNHSLIKEKNMKLKDVQNAVVRILSQINGIADVVTSNQLNDNNYSTGIRMKIQNGYHRKRSGDIVYLLEPGLVEYKRTGTTHGSGYAYDTHVPLLWYGWKIPSGHSSDIVNITDIAATLAQLLHIEFPNGCKGEPIKQLLK